MNEKWNMGYNRLRKGWQIVLWVLGSLGLVVAIGLLFMLFTDRLSENTVSSYLTAILVGVTAIYVLLTHELVHETRQARRQAVRPVLTHDADLSSLLITNVGEGRALDITVTLSIAGDGKDDMETTIERGILQPGGSFRIRDAPFNQLGDSEADVHQEYDRVTISYEYNDAFNHPYTDSLQLQTAAFVTDRTPNSDVMNRIATELERIRTAYTEDARRKGSQQRTPDNDREKD